MSPTFVLPDLYKEWPFKATLNLHQGISSAASAERVESFHALDRKAQAVFNRCKFPLLASLALSRAGPDHLRLACDLINWFFVFDEWSDIKDGAFARELAVNITDILKNPSRSSPAENSARGEMTKCFWSRILAFSRPSSAQRLLESLCPYIEAVFEEAEDREHGRMRNVDDYLALRREIVGARPCFDLILLPADIPQDIITHPRIECLTRGAVGLIILTNDIYSYNYERSHGLDGHNIVSAVMKEKELDVQGAIDYIGRMYHDVAQKFMEDTKDIPPFSPTIDHILADYVFGMTSWVAALIEWSFESTRYFGTQGSEIRRTRIVELRSGGVGSS